MGASTIAKQARRSAGVSAARRVSKSRRHFRLRKKVVGTAERPRLVVSRSARHLFAQVVDDAKGVTLASVSTYRLADGDKTAQAKQAGAQLADAAKAAGVSKDMSFITTQIGMFSYSGLSKDQMVRLRTEFGVYGTDTGRMCVAALNSKNIDYVCQAIAKVI